MRLPRLLPDSPRVEGMPASSGLRSEGAPTLGADVAVDGAATCGGDLPPVRPVWHLLVRPGEYAGPFDREALLDAARALGVRP